MVHPLCMNLLVVWVQDHQADAPHVSRQTADICRLFLVTDAAVPPVNCTYRNREPLFLVENPGGSPRRTRVPSILKAQAQEVVETDGSRRTSISALYSGEGSTTTQDFRV